MFSAAGVKPVPFRLTVPLITEPELSRVVVAVVRSACRPPTAEGVNITWTVQLPPPASVAEQFDELALKSPAAAPETAKFSPDKGSPPGFAIVTVCAVLGVPIPVPGKVRAVGVRLKAAGASPVPDVAIRTKGTPRLVLDTTTVPL
jgi:hypothetical protein